MPETAQNETPARRTMRQWFQAKIAERMMQAGHLAQNREMLRRGAIKMQDGTLGQDTGEPEAEARDDMNIRVGDEVHHHYPEPAAEPTEPGDTTRARKARSSWLLPAALVVGSALTGGAVPTGILIYQALKAASEPAPVVQQGPAVEDMNTLYELHLSKGGSQ